MRPQVLQRCSSNGRGLNGEGEHMTEEETEPPAVLPESICESAGELSDHQLKELIDYCGSLLQSNDRQLLEEIEAGPDEEIIRIEERDTYTEVVKRVPCGEDCEECPHGPYLYHVRDIPAEDGGRRLSWRFLGRMNE
jgi:hypothetical protein